jgi:hypothetical protein
MQMKMFLTRLGEGSRMVITGDRSQVDLPRGVASGLADAERLLKGIDRISFSYFTAKDVVRHPLVARIIEAYDADGEPARCGRRNNPAIVRAAFAFCRGVSCSRGILAIACLAIPAEAQDSTPWLGENVESIIKEVAPIPRFPPDCLSPDRRALFAPGMSLPQGPRALPHRR